MDLSRTRVPTPTEPARPGGRNRRNVERETEEACQHQKLFFIQRLGEQPVFKRKSFFRQGELSSAKSISRRTQRLERRALRRAGNAGFACWILEARWWWDSTWRNSASDWVNSP